MSLWDELPSNATSGGALDTLKPVLQSVSAPSHTDRPESDGTWRIWSTTLGGDSPLNVDLASGALTRGPAGSGAAGSGGALEVAGGVTLELGLKLDSTSNPDGTARLMVITPKAAVKVPFLRGAKLDAQGQLRADGAHPDVRFLLPGLRIRLLRPVGGALAVDLLSATTVGPPVNQMYDLIRMEPPYALVGPGDVVGFAFRAAVLDLSGDAGPTGVPAGARVMPAEWQGLYLPEVRLFVAPEGLEGLAVSAGVRNLWIGIGRHAGVTGEFNAEVVNRGGTPQVRLRFQTPTGEWIGVPDPDPIPDVELPEHVTLYVDAGGGLAPLTSVITVDGVVTTSDRADVTVPSAGDVHISVTVTDGGSHTHTRTLTVRRRTTAGGAPGSGDQPVTSTTTSSSGFDVVVTAQSATGVTVALSPEATGTVAWAWSGGSASGATADVPVAAGATVTVTATVNRTTAATTTIDAYSAFDHPTQPELDAGGSTPWELNPEHLTAQPWAERTSPGAARPLLDEAGRARLAALPKDTAWTVEGFASYEGHDDQGHVDSNQALSERRRDALIKLLRTDDATRYPELGFTNVTAGVGHGQVTAKASGGGGTPAPGSPTWWRATASGHVNQTVTVTAQLQRPTTPPPANQVDPAPTRAPVPACFHMVGVTVELVRSTFVRAEIYGEVDIQTAAEQRLAANGAGPLPARTNPSDGVSRFLLRLRISEDRSSWDVTGEFRAVEADTDGLWQVKRGTGSQTGLDVLGAVAVLSPLLAAATPPAPTAGELVPMVVVGGAAVAIGAAGVLTTRSITLHGGKVVVSSGLVDPTNGNGPRTTQISVLLDVETAFTFDIGIIKVEPTKPLTTRYKAVGVRSQWRSDPQPDGTIQYVPLPVFDPAAGYSLDIPAGSLVAPGPLGELLRVLGARISRDNPMYLEVEVGLGVDLGIVTVDSARVRLRLDALEVPQLTALGASIDVPGVLHGSGYVSITPTGFEGAFDVTLTPLNLRISAQLAVGTENGVTGVLVGAEIQFPVPLPLANSGIAIYGFLGGVAVNFARREGTGQAPALSWLEQQLAPPRESVMHPAGWKLTPGAYAVAGGILLGTAEGGFIVHLKGIVLVEVPGPRVLFAMKADVLSAPPALKGSQTATFLAVLDLDFGRGTITIGVVAAYEIKSLLTVRVPVTAFFSTNDLDAWFVDLGTNTEPVTVSILDVFEGTGYLMIHGDGTTVHIPELPVVTQGLTIAVGFHLRAVLMGSKSVGLYLEVAAGFDAVVSFSPFAIGGHISVSGELRLWIIGISASASLTVLVGPQKVDEGTPTEHIEDRTYIHGEVCGKVDFFFFSVEGCVSLTIGDNNPAPLVPPPLVSGVSLVSRSPALVEGTAVDRAVDGVIGTAVATGAPGDLPSVPLDAVPVVLFSTGARVAPGNVILGGTARGSSSLPADPWVKKGETWWRYRISSVELVGDLTPAPPTGKTPATWWARTLVGDPQVGPALALLSWLPTPASRAVPLGQQLTTTVEHRWGTICTPVAEPAPVLWTFDTQPTGPSDVGWKLAGVAWPDAPGTWRSSPVDGRAAVRERWRTGDELVDLLQGTDPAVVVGDQVACRGRDQRGLVAARGAATGFGPGALPLAGPGTQDVLDLLATGGSFSEVETLWSASAWGDPTGGHGKDGCQGRILRSPAEDEGEPGGTDDAEVGLVKQTWDALGFGPSDLGDGVLVRVEAGLQSLDVLLLVPRKAIERGLVLSYRDSSGAVLDTRDVNGSDLISASNPVPPGWLDGSGPWADPVFRAVQIATRIMAAQPGLVPVLVRDKPKDGTVEVEIGWDRHREDLVATPFWLVAFAGTTAAESIRSDWDTTVVTDDKDALTDAVTQDPDDHALLLPGRDYTVKVVWQAQSVTQEARPDSSTPETWGTATTQEFRFHADGTDKAPARLDPWLLATSPAPGEIGPLTDDPLRIALATQKVAALFDAYGEELRFVVRSASGRHPEPPSGGGAGDPEVLPVAIGALASIYTAAPDGLQVMTPWQETVTALLDELPCTAGSGSTTHHSVVTLAYDLAPLTDYLLDVLAVPKGAPKNAAGRRIYRVPFTTSRFATVTQLADLTRLTTVRHSLVPVPAALATLPERPVGAVLDAAFQAAGLAVPQVPRYPSVVVLWSPDAVPQPVAVVVEGSEAMWRSRPMPTKVPGPTDDDPTHEWWAARERDWMFLAAATAAPPPGSPAQAPVTRIVRGPGGTRAVVLLGPGARGTELRLDLVRAADELAASPEARSAAVHLMLDTAPWEVED